MGKLKDAVWDWLEDCGYDLGYDWDNLPSLGDMTNIKKQKITYTKYKGDNYDE